MNINILLRILNELLDRSVHKCNGLSGEKVSSFSQVVFKYRLWRHMLGSHV